MIYCVYLISAEINNSKLYKIGYTRRSIYTRINEFKTGNASEFEIVDSFKSKWGTKIEANLHRLFRQNKINGEWFKLSDMDVENFKVLCKRIHDSFELISKENSWAVDKRVFK